MKEGYTFYRALPNKGDTIEEKTRNRWTGSVLSAIVVSSLLFPGAAGANSTPGAVSFTKDLSSSKSIQHKISDSVKKRFEKMIKSRFLSNLKRKPIRKSGQRSRKNAESQSLSAAKTEYQKRSAVVSSLKLAAHDAQQNLKTYLEKQKRKERLITSIPIILSTEWQSLLRKR